MSEFITNEQKAVAAMRLPGVLEECGWASLRKGQDEACFSLIYGENLLCVLPTGWGKTAAFVIPTLCHRWKTLVFSPLIALMFDQVDNLRKRGVRAAYVNSLRTPANNRETFRQWGRGDIDLLFVAPERQSNEEFVQAMAHRAPDAVVVDEAHVITSWADSFRHSYRLIPQFLQEHQPKVVAAFTATLPPHVEADVRAILGLSGAKKVIYWPRRDNLLLQAAQFMGLRQIADLVKQAGGPSLVYGATINNVTGMFDRLSPGLMSSGIRAGIYHGEMLNTEKRRVLDGYLGGELDVIFATKAFGMGVDKPDIRAVIHRDVPGSLEDLTQEVGRAGRDGQPSMCTTLFDTASFDTQQYFIDNNHPPRHLVESAFRVIERTAVRGVCPLTRQEIATKAGCRDSRDLIAVFELLLGHEVVESMEREKLAGIRFLKEPDDPDTKSRVDVLRGVVEVLADCDSQGWFELDINDLVIGCRKAEGTVKGWLRDWAQDEYVDYIPPPRGKPLRIIGDIRQIDFERLRQRKIKAEERLGHVSRYRSEEEKHSYLERYFYTGTV